jgi:nitronate monooxygenase
MGVGVSMAGLASAVARAGGLGCISAVGLGFTETKILGNYLSANITSLRQQVRLAKEQCGGGAIGVNIMVALSDFGDYVRAAAEEGADVIFSGAGLPMNLPGLVPEGLDVKLVPIVSSHRAATLLCKKWKAKFGRLPDGFVVEGPLAGGHLGFREELIDDPAYKLEALVPEVLDAVRPFEQEQGRPIPVIAAGGIFTGADMADYLAMGAAAVQLGTRFVATTECDASQEFKDAYVNCGPDDIVILKSPVGLPGRAIRNQFTEDISHGGKRPIRCPYRCIVTCDAKESPYCIANALLNARAGKFDNGFAFAGANAARVEGIVTVQQLMDSLLDEYCQACNATPVEAS